LSDNLQNKNFKVSIGFSPYRVTGRYFGRGWGQLFLSWRWL